MTSNALLLLCLTVAEARTPEWIELDVRLPDGTQPSAARIDWDRGGTGGPPVQLHAVKTWTPERPGVDLPDALLRLTAVCGPEQGAAGLFRSEPTTVDARQQHEDVITLMLRPRAGVSITLSLDGDPADGEVLVHPLGDGEAVDLELLASDGQVHPARRGRADVELSPGRYVVGATLGHGLAVIAHEVIDVGWPTTDVSIDLDSSRAELAFDVELLVQGTSYKGFLDLAVQAIRGGGPLRVDWMHVRRADGSFVLIPDAPGIRLLNAVEQREPGAAATLILKLLGDDGSRTSFGAPLRPSHRQVAISLEGVAGIELTIDGGVPDGPALRAAVRPRASVWHWPDEHEDLRESAWSDVVDGSASLGPVPATAVDLVLYAMRDGEPSHTVAVKAVDLAVGRNEVTFALPELHDARIEVEAPVTELTLFRFDIGPTLRRQVRDGAATFEHLPAGEYLLSSDAWGPILMCQDVPLSLPANRRVRFTPPPLDAVRVQVVDSEGPGATLGLRDEDLIVGMDGKRFHEDPRGALQIFGVRGVAVELLVLRGRDLIRLPMTLPWHNPDPAIDGLRFVGSSSRMAQALVVVPEDH